MQTRYDWSVQFKLLFNWGFTGASHFHLGIPAKDYFRCIYENKIASVTVWLGSLCPHCCLHSWIKLPCWCEIRWLTWPPVNISFVCLVKVLGCCHSKFWVIVLLPCAERIWAEEHGSNWHLWLSQRSLNMNIYHHGTKKADKPLSCIYKFISPIRSFLLI